MRAALISIRPEWCELIAAGKKTLEVRKSRPKLPLPFKVYIYCTSGAVKRIAFDEYGDRQIELVPQKVIGEFVCKKMSATRYFPDYEGNGRNHSLPPRVCRDACLSREEIEEYLGEKDGYFWHISDLVIYDKPKPLSRFSRCPYPWDCAACDLFDGIYMSCDRKIRPPQSWCYVEERNDGK